MEEKRKRFVDTKNSWKSPLRRLGMHFPEDRKEYHLIKKLVTERLAAPPHGFNVRLGWNEVKDESRRRALVYRVKDFFADHEPPRIISTDTALHYTVWLAGSTRRSDFRFDNELKKSTGKHVGRGRPRTSAKAAKRRERKEALAKKRAAKEKAKAASDGAPDTSDSDRPVIVPKIATKEKTTKSSAVVTLSDDESEVDTPVPRPVRRRTVTSKPTDTDEEMDEDPFGLKAKEMFKSAKGIKASSNDPSSKLSSKSQKESSKANKRLKAPAVQEPDDDGDTEEGSEADAAPLTPPRTKNKRRHRPKLTSVTRASASGTEDDAELQAFRVMLFDPRVRFKAVEDSDDSEESYVDSVVGSDNDDHCHRYSPDYSSSDPPSEDSSAYPSDDCFSDDQEVDNITPTPHKEKVVPNANDRHKASAEEHTSTRDGSSVEPEGEELRSSPPRGFEVARKPIMSASGRTRENSIEGIPIVCLEQLPVCHRLSWFPGTTLTCLFQYGYRGDDPDLDGFVTDTWSVTHTADPSEASLTLGDTTCSDWETTEVQVRARSRRQNRALVRTTDEKRKAKKDARDKAKADQDEADRLEAIQRQEARDAEAKQHQEALEQVRLQKEALEKEASDLKTRTEKAEEEARSRLAAIEREAAETERLARERAAEVVRAAEESARKAKDIETAALAQSQATTKANIVADAKRRACTKRQVDLEAKAKRERQQAEAIAKEKAKKEKEQAEAKARKAQEQAEAKAKKEQEQAEAKAKREQEQATAKAETKAKKEREQAEAKARRDQEQAQAKAEAKAKKEREQAEGKAKRAQEQAKAKELRQKQAEEKKKKDDAAAKEAQHDTANDNVNADVDKATAEERKKTQQDLEFARGGFKTAAVRKRITRTFLPPSTQGASKSRTYIKSKLPAFSATQISATQALAETPVDPKAWIKKKTGADVYDLPEGISDSDYETLPETQGRMSKLKRRHASRAANMAKLATSSKN